MKQKMVSQKYAEELKKQIENNKELKIKQNEMNPEEKRINQTGLASY